MNEVTKDIKERLYVDPHAVPNSVPAMKSYPHQRSLVCYGRGRRLCDIQLPEMPTIVSSQHEKTSSVRAIQLETVPKPKPGSGRGKRRKSLMNQGEEQRSHSASPVGLREHASTEQGACSVSSAESNEDLKTDQQLKTSNSELGNKGTPSLTSRQHSSALSPAPDRNLERQTQNSLVRENNDYSSPSGQNGSVSDSQPLKDVEGWTVEPPCVCQLEGIPVAMDLKVVHDLFCSYGTIVDWEEKRHDASISLRVKLTDAAICDEIETNIDESDFSGTGSVVRCIHLKS